MSCLAWCTVTGYLVGWAQNPDHRKLREQHRVGCGTEFWLFYRTDGCADVLPSFPCCPRSFSESPCHRPHCSRGQHEIPFPLPDTKVPNADLVWPHRWYRTLVRHNPHWTGACVYESCPVPIGSEGKSCCETETLVGRTVSAWRTVYSPHV